MALESFRALELLNVEPPAGWRSPPGAVNPAPVMAARLWASALGDLDEVTIKRAVLAHVRSEFGFRWPTPADIRRHAGVTDRSADMQRADEAAWDHVLAALRHGEVWDPVDAVQRAALGSVATSWTLRRADQWALRDLRRRFLASCARLREGQLGARPVVDPTPAVPRLTEGVPAPDLGELAREPEPLHAAGRREVA